MSNMYRKPTIAEEGGLKVHVEKLGGKWNVFMEYWNDERIKHNELGRLVSRDRSKPFDGRTIKSWRHYYRDNELVGKRG